jgi:DNA-binding response OmpR family regulator
MRQTQRMLLIESDPTLAAGLTTFLETEGYHVTLAADGVTGLNLVRRIQADLIIVDAELAGIDGITLCGAIRSQVGTPLILLTNGGDELQHVIGLDRGADLCMVKPISSGELRARIRSLLRRAALLSPPGGQAIAIGDLRVDVQVRRAWLGDKELQLTPKEFELLAYLMKHRGMALSRDQLLKDVWGGRVDSSSQTLDVHIRWLRQKVEPHPDQPIYIRTVRMIGYRFEGPGPS